MKKFLVLFIICGLTLSLPAGKKSGGKKSPKKSSVSQKSSKGKSTANKASKEKGNSEKASRDKGNSEKANKDKKCDKDKKNNGEKQVLGEKEIIGVKDTKDQRTRLSEEEREELMKERIEKRKAMREEMNSKDK